MRDKLVMKYQYPDDVEIAMDQFAADNPNAGWREFQREFERAMLRSMQPGGQLYEKFTLTVLMTDDDKTTPIISLAAKRKESERDFAQERADLTKELEEIGVAADQLAAITQHTNAMGKMKAIACGGVHDLRAFWQRFYEQRRAAGQRGVEWQLDFRQWLEIWQASGHLHERGRCRGQFQMCRSGDIGPYASSTVRIDRMENNASEGRLRLERQAGGVTACSS